MVKKEAMQNTRRLITVVTPAYNRASLLPRLYNSLVTQSCKDFEWMIVDDGSTDNTKSVVEGFKATTSEFNITYYHKENGGKHTALNLAFKQVKTELLIIVDSDDRLTLDAIDTIKHDWLKTKEIENSRKICGLGYLKCYNDNKIIGDLYSGDYFVSNFITERFNKGVDGDKAEVWVTGCLRNFKFPEYKGEKFISESVAWIWLAERFDMLFINKPIYVVEYLQGGLSDTGRQLRFKCPHLMAYGSLMTMTKSFSLKIRIKETLLYIVYSLFGKFGWHKIFDCKYKFLVALCALPGWGLYRIWKRKYKL